MRTRLLLIPVALVLIVAGLAAWPVFTRHNQASAATNVYASPIQAGCYIAGQSDCRLHVEPFTIELAPGSKLVKFQLLAASPGGSPTVIYDFRPDVSNPVPFTGSTFTPSLVAQDFAAACGKSYSIYLEGQDTFDTSVYALGSTGQFTCPAAIP